MKIGASRTGKALGLIFTAASIVAVAQSGCGKPDSAASPLGTRGDGTGMVPMKGIAAFGSQCASGFNNDPKAVRLELWQCPLNVNQVELVEPITPLYLSADCARKTLTIRNLSHTIDVNWELMPDGSFYITQDGLSAKLKDDGSGHADCVTPISADMWGKVDCTNPRGDQAKIRFETVMWLNKRDQPSSAASPTPNTTNPNLPPASTVDSSSPQCKLPVGKCYFHAVASINQCL
jgi:hypothetical protein